jgi:hypothetical protein
MAALIFLDYLVTKVDLCSSIFCTGGIFGKRYLLDMLPSMTILCGNASKKRSREDTLFVPSKRRCLNQSHQSASMVLHLKQSVDTHLISVPRQESLEIVQTAEHSINRS